MKPAPQRIIAHIFMKTELPSAHIAKMRTQMEGICEAEGHALVDLIIDRGPPKRDAAEHASLLRIARGEADGLMLSQMPLTLTPKKSADVLLSHLDGPIVFLKAAELAERGLLPGGTKYTQHRSLTDAASRAVELHAEGMSLRDIAGRLHAEGFRPLRGGEWFPASIAKLLEHREGEPTHADPEDSHAS